MEKNYSIADARNSLSGIIHAAEKHGPITLTRRGKAVAVVVSEADFSKLSQNKKDYWEALQAFRTHHDFAENALDEEDLYELPLKIYKQSPR